MHTTLVDPATLERHLGDPRWIVLDVRHELTQPSWGEEEYREEHIPGARFLHLDRDLSATKTGRNGRHPLPSASAAAATFGAAGIDATKQVVVYDQGPGAYAARCWWMLRWLGHDAVAVLDGGFDRWMRERRPITADAPVVAPASFRARVSLPVVGAGDVLADLARGPSTVVLDARSPERFRGEAEPFDPVAGRVPGAKNRPVAQNLAKDGTFKPAAELRAELAAMLGPRDGAQVIHMCGSGVTACHNMLAMAVAGLPAGRLYAGSWSEWCADPARPVAKGP
jgi:thiosulfate/3-mercaptopyruvate sulfurtransferase